MTALGIVLIVVGGLWALIGLGNVVSVWKGNASSSTSDAVALLINSVLFILPGLVITGLGAVVHRLGAGRRGIADGRRKCPHCAELIKIEARVCRYCGREVLAEQGEKPGALATCSECSGHVSADAARCPHCGTPAPVPFRGR